MSVIVASKVVTWDHVLLGTRGILDYENKLRYCCFMSVWFTGHALYYQADGVKVPSIATAIASSAHAVQNIEITSIVFGALGQTMRNIGDDTLPQYSIGIGAKNISYASGDLTMKLTHADVSTELENLYSLDGLSAPIVFVVTYRM